jgi:hypothetical protein
MKNKTEQEEGGGTSLETKTEGKCQTSIRIEFRIIMMTIWKSRDRRGEGGVSIHMYVCNCE